MKLNISYPVTGGQKVIEVEDENKLRAFYDKRISHEVEGEALGDEFKGYIFKISGGNDKQGFPMLQGVLTNQRVRLLFRDGYKCYRIRKRGEMKRKSVRGCIVSADLSVLDLVVVKKGEKDIEGLTDVVRPRRLGPKRATRIRKLFNLTKEDDVRKYVIRRAIVRDGKKTQYKAPKIQRLVTPERLQRRRRLRVLKRERTEKTREEAKAYNELLNLRFKERRDATASKRRTQSRKQSEKSKAEKQSAKAKARAKAESETEKTDAAPAADKKEKKKKKKKHVIVKKQQEAMQARKAKKAAAATKA